jgi:hypothetical protein
MTTHITPEEVTPWTTAQPSPAARGRLREAFHRIHLAVQEMNYGARRVVEVQAPWVVDKPRDRR